MRLVRHVCPGAVVMEPAETLTPTERRGGPCQSAGPRAGTTTGAGTQQTCLR